MPADVYLKTTNYPARPYAGPGILHTPQLVPQACPPTLTDYSIMVPMVGPRGGKGRVRGEAETRGPLASPFTLGRAPCLPLSALSGGYWHWTLLPSALSYSANLQKAIKGEGTLFSHALGPWHWSDHLAPSASQCLSFMSIQVLPHSPSWAGRGNFHPQTHLSQPSTPGLPPRPEKG